MLVQAGRRPCMRDVDLLMCANSAYKRAIAAGARCRLVGDEARDAADLWLINTCTVKSPSQSAMDNLLRRGRQAGKALLVAGCVPQVGDRQAEAGG